MTNKQKKNALPAKFNIIIIIIFKWKKRNWNNMNKLYTCFIVHWKTDDRKTNYSLNLLKIIEVNQFILATFKYQI